MSSIVLEKDDVVGGLSRTVRHGGFHFDIGGHRFFTKVKAVDDLWHEVLGQDFRRCQRLSRIYYRKKFFFYPLKPANALFNLGVWNAVWILLSYLKAQAFPGKLEESFEQWVSNRFGKRLYQIFFKTYTEKVWGIPCSEITAEWAAQRIKGLSLLTALTSAFMKGKNRDKGSTIKTLIDAFDYPRLGPGQMWETVARKVTQQGTELRLGTDVAAVLWKPNRVTGILTDTKGRSEEIEGSHFVSSMPIRDLLQRFVPAVPDSVLKAATSLNYRDFLTVALVIRQPDLFPDNWIYVHDPDVKLGRIQNFKNWSPDMVPDQHKTCLGLEYFCFEGDGLWSMSDRELIELGTRELDILGLAKASDVEDGAVVRMQKAYPVYDSGYVEALGIVRGFTDRIENLQLVGRNGMHKYNNQDHSMLTAMLAVKNILGGTHDLWGVNADQDYHEEVTGNEGSDHDLQRAASTQPKVPRRLEKSALH
ncbi:MAG: protoporphyrinogen oxidase [Chloroflexi bacterium]|nr:protoporphyrinogen oxidase [Chloroflexota bacterium]